jgi:adenosylhomocysteine nucleosidase
LLRQPPGWSLQFVAARIETETALKQRSTIQSGIDTSEQKTASVTKIRQYIFCLALLFCLLGSIGEAAQPATAGELIDSTPRIAVISAFEPEWKVLQTILRDRADHAVNGMTFLTGTISGKPVVVFQSGIGMVNAAMTTQLALERFHIESMVFSGIGGGVNPDLSIGDVVVPQEWTSLQVVLARQTGDGYVLPDFFDRPVQNFGMMFPQPTQIAQMGRQPEKRLWFAVDAHLLDIAGAVSGKIALKNCTTDHKCLERQPKVRVGGRGVSGQAFVDNSTFRDYVRRAFNADVLDMESAAVAHVAYANHVPFIAFRSLSDLAGADHDKNQMNTFEQLASGNSATLLETFLAALH